MAFSMHGEDRSAPGPVLPYRRNGFSPDVTRTLMEALVRHGDDMMLLSARLQRAGRSTARSAGEAAEFAGIAAEMERLVIRIRKDAYRAMAETGKLGTGPTPITYCACGKGIETGECVSGGACYRALAVDLRS